MRRPNRFATLWILSAPLGSPMSRVFAFAVFFGVTSALGVLALGACGDPAVEPTRPTTDAGPNLRRDSAPVDPGEAGAPPDAPTSSEPNCEKYCDLVMANCSATNAQYTSKAECLAFCGHLPLQAETRGGNDEKSSASVACRQYWADSPAQTSPDTYCLAAGPYGGNTCGDRCTAFCRAVLSICPPSGAKPPYADQPQCASACADFSYRDAGADGGGEGPSGPTAGDSLNCRLHLLRAALTQPGKCADLSAVSETCRD